MRANTRNVCRVRSASSTKANNVTRQHDQDEIGTKELSAELTTPVTGSAKATRIEAYGTRGWKNTSWRRTFASAEKLAEWCDQHDATVLGTRTLE